MINRPARLVTFRSIVVPIKAIVLNLLSVGVEVGHEPTTAPEAA